MPDHDWQNCEICHLYVMRYGEAYFDPETGWHPRPTTVLQTNEGGWAIVSGLSINPPGERMPPGQDSLDNLHRLKDGEVVLCWSLN
jgi:hypothetical protein